MGIKDLGENLKRFVAGRAEPREDLGDEVTTDNFLRSLRRQRRIQLEEGEKKQLQTAIAEHEKKRQNEHLFGIKREVAKQQLIKKIKKQRGMIGKAMLGRNGFGSSPRTSITSRKRKPSRKKNKLFEKYSLR